MSETAPSPAATTGLSIATLVLGVLALVLSPLLLGMPLAIAGLAVALVAARERPARRGMLRWGVGLSLCGLLAGAAFGALYYRLYKEWREQWASFDGIEERDGPEWIGMSVPALRFSTLEGEEVDLAQFAGRPMVITFWATWCGPCRAEIPHLERLAREVPEAAVLGLSDEPEATLREFTAKQPIAYRIASVPDPPAPFDGVQSLPTTVFVDRKGVIREVHVGLQTFEELRERVLGPAFEGSPRPPQAAAVVDPGSMPVVKERWNVPVAGAGALATCNWDADPAHEVLVQDGKHVLHVLDAAGREKAQVALPEGFGNLECANGADGSVRLLGYQPWGRSVTVLDATGRALWSYPGETGVNGAHWGDLDGDGEPEIVVGFNGGAGLHAVSAKGRRLWAVTTIGNVWHQAVLPAEEGREAVVAATEAGGTVRLFDGEGSQTAELRPLGDYYTAVEIAATGAGQVQVVATGQKRVIAFDSAGAVAWQIELKPDAQGRFFTRGDLAGDSAAEWVFPSRARQLLIVSAAGARIAELDRKAGAAFVVLPGAGGHGVLVVSDSETVRAYALEPPPS